MTQLVSIIIPTYNSEKTLQCSLQSIIEQTYPNKEIIVIDGESSDTTVSIVKKYQRQYPFITCLSEKDSGIYDAMNKGISLAKGDYLFFLGSDDEFYSSTVLESIFSNQENTDFDLIYGNVFFRHSKFIYSGESNLEKLIGEQVSICHQAIFYKRKIFRMVGCYNLKYFVHADYDLNVKCFEHPEIKTKYVDEIVALYNEQGKSGAESNKDGFHDQLTLHYISKYTSPFQLILKIKHLEQQLYTIKGSNMYKLLQLFSKIFSRIRTAPKVSFRVIKKI